MMRLTCLEENGTWDVRVEQCYCAVVLSAVPTELLAKWISDGPLQLDLTCRSRVLADVSKDIPS